MAPAGSDITEQNRDGNNNEKRPSDTPASLDVTTGKENEHALSVDRTQGNDSDTESEATTTARIDTKVSATVVQFCPVSSKPEVARVQLVLCNISDRPLQFNIKCVGGNSVTAFPTGHGDIDARGQSRLTLTWHRPPEYAAWSDTPNPKMLLVIKFQARKSGEESTPTTIRLLGKINMKFCKPDKPPEEQLLLDADHSANDVVVSKRMPIPKNTSRSRTPRSRGGNRQNKFADLNSQDLIIFVIVVYLLVFFMNALTK